ncbi:MAG: cell division protein SepF [Gracilibacteraceae bacterium]|jgi:cell division inhibitor SepF|nr:cell division protein SepF [Gracilibacteraceae bacterium]
MGKIWDKILGVGIDDEDDEEFAEQEEERKPRRRGRSDSEPAAAKEQEPAGFFGGNPFQGGTASKKQAPVVNVYSQKQYKVIVVKPFVFEESKSIAEHLKARRSVIINLEKTDEDLAQRIVDFISGTTYALGGSMQKVGEGIFMFVPSNVDINDEVSIHSSEHELPWTMTR